jgi:hypothetical protein
VSSLGQVDTCSLFIQHMHILTQIFETFGQLSASTVFINTYTNRLDPMLTTEPPTALPQRPIRPAAGSW